MTADLPRFFCALAVRSSLSGLSTRVANLESERRHLRITVDALRDELITLTANIDTFEVRAPAAACRVAHRTRALTTSFFPGPPEPRDGHPRRGADHRQQLAAPTSAAGRGRRARRPASVVPADAGRRAGDAHEGPRPAVVVAQPRCARAPPGRPHRAVRLDNAQTPRAGEGSEDELSADALDACLCLDLSFPLARTGGGGGVRANGGMVQRGRASRQRFSVLVRRLRRPRLSSLWCLCRSTRCLPGGGGARTSAGVHRLHKSARRGEGTHSVRRP